MYIFPFVFFIVIDSVEYRISFWTFIRRVLLFINNVCNNRNGQYLSTQITPDGNIRLTVFEFRSTFSATICLYTIIHTVQAKSLSIDLRSPFTKSRSQLSVRAAARSLITVLNDVINQATKINQTNVSGKTAKIFL